MKSYGTEARHVLQAGRGQTETRDVAVYLVRELAGARLRSIGAASAGLSQASVSLAASRIARRLLTPTSRSFCARALRWSISFIVAPDNFPVAGLCGADVPDAPGRFHLPKVVFDAIRGYADTLRHFSPGN